MVRLGRYVGMAQRLRIFWFVIVALLPTSILLAQVPLAKIATVSFTDAVMQTNEAQRDFGALQSKFAPRQAQIETLNKEIEDLRKLLSNPGENLSDADRSSRMQTLSAKEKQLQREEEDFRNDSQSESQAAFQVVAKKVFDFLQDYAKQRGYAVVIERGNDTSPIVWYAAQDIDITSGLISAYNIKSGVPAPGPSIHGNPSPTQPPNAPVPSKPRP